jgi:hypothetical protein
MENQQAVANQDRALAWEVRYTWTMSRGVVHPEHTFASYESETRAVDLAVSMMDRQMPGADLTLVRVEIRERDGSWRVIR